MHILRAEDPVDPNQGGKEHAGESGADQLPHTGEWEGSGEDRYA